MTTPCAPRWWRIRPASREFARGAPIATDDNGRIEFAVADALLRGQSEPVTSLLAGL